MYDQNDVLYNDFVIQSGSTSYADINLGAYFHHKNYFIGYSIFQLAPNKIQLDNSADVTLNTNHFLVGGYYYDLNDKVQLAPSFLMKKLFTSPTTWDLNLVATYDKMFWGGVGYRTSDAMVFMLGSKFDNGLKIGYSYDFTVSGFKGQAYGSHELTLGFAIKDNKRGPRRRRR